MKSLKNTILSSCAEELRTAKYGNDLDEVTYGKLEILRKVNGNLNRLMP